MTTEHNTKSERLPPEDETPAVDQAIESRRKLLKGALSGAGAAAVVPEAWANPVVNTVVLPAHATTSLIDSGQNDSGGVTTTPVTSIPVTTVPVTL